MITASEEEVARALFDYWTLRNRGLLDDPRPLNAVDLAFIEARWAIQKENYLKVAHERIKALDASGFAIVRRWDE